MLNAEKTQRREKLAVAGLASLIFGAENSRPVDWVRPTMLGETKHPAQALMRGIEAIKFAARPYESDTNKGGSPEWEADICWLRHFMGRVYSAAPKTTETLYEAIVTWAATALDLLDNQVLLPMEPEIIKLRELLEETRAALGVDKYRPAYSVAIMDYARRTNG